MYWNRLFEKKLLEYDIGLDNYIIGIKDKNILLNGPMAGQIFETAIISEIVKKNMGKD